MRHSLVDPAASAAAVAGVEAAGLFLDPMIPVAVAAWAIRFLGHNDLLCFHVDNVARFLS